MSRTSQGVSRTSQGVSRTSLSQETKPEMNMLLVMPLSYTGDWETSGRMVKGSDMTVNGLVDMYCVVESTVVPTSIKPRILQCHCRTATRKVILQGKFWP